MEHMAWKGRIKPGCKAEYQRRHAEISPEIVEVLKAAADGVRCHGKLFPNGDGDRFMIESDDD